MLNELKTRGIKDVFLFCVDGLTGYRQAIEAAFPNAQIQRCIIHQIRSSTRFVSYKHIKELMADLKKVYQAISEEEAMNNLILFKDKWGKTYPSCVKSWEENWDILSTFFAYPPEVRKIIYTTNIIEGLNRQFRQITKNKPSFTNDDSLRKMLYLASQKIVERWTQRCRNWDIVLSQLSIIFEDRIPDLPPRIEFPVRKMLFTQIVHKTFRRQERKVNTGQIRKPDYTAIRCFVIA